MSMKTLARNCLRAAAECVAAAEKRCPVRRADGRICGRPATVESEVHGFPTCRGCDEAAREEGKETR